VLHDSTDSIPVKQYNGDVSATESSQKSTTKNDLSGTTKEKPIKTNYKPALPIHTQGLSVGQVKKRQVSIPDLKTPVCVLGSDEQSLDWLATNQKQLARIGARCLLIQAENQADIKRIKKRAEGLPVIAVSGDAIVDSFGLQHYPALISKQWIEQ